MQIYGIAAGWNNSSSLLEDYSSSKKNDKKRKIMSKEKMENEKCVWKKRKFSSWSKRD